MGCDEDEDEDKNLGNDKDISQMVMQSEIFYVIYLSYIFFKRQ